MKKEFREFFRGKNNLILISILLLSMFLRSTAFFLPHKSFDELVYQTLAKKTYYDPLDYTLRGTGFLNSRFLVLGHEMPVPPYYDEPLFHIPPLFVYMISLSYRLFGIEIPSAALVPFLFGSITCLVVYLIASKLFDKKVAILASFFSAISPIHWVASSKIWNDVVMAFFIALTFYFFYWGIEKGNSKFIILAGLFEGLALLTKQAAILVFPALLLYGVIIEASSKGAFIERMSIFILISLLIFSPWLFWVTSIYKVPWYLPEISKEVLQSNPWFILVTNRPWYYLLISLPLTVPFYLFSYMGIVKLRREKPFILLVLWFLSFLIFFTLYPSGEVRFLIGALPALDILASAYIVDKLENLRGYERTMILTFLGIAIIASLYVGAHKIYYNADLLGVLYWI